MHQCRNQLSVQLARGQAFPSENGGRTETLESPADLGRNGKSDGARHFVGQVMSNLRALGVGPFFAFEGEEVARSREQCLRVDRRIQAEQQVARVVIPARFKEKIVRLNQRTQDHHALLNDPFLGRQQGVQVVLAPPAQIGGPLDSWEEQSPDEIEFFRGDSVSHNRWGLPAYGAGNGLANQMALFWPDRV